MMVLFICYIEKFSAVYSLKNVIIQNSEELFWKEESYTKF